MIARANVGLRVPAASVWLLILAASAAGAVDVTWTGNGPTNLWGDSANWNPEVVPNNGVDQYRVTIGSGASVILGSSVEVDFLDVGSNATLEISQANLDIDTGAGTGIVNDGTIQIGAPGETVAAVRFGGSAELAGFGTFVFGGENGQFVDLSGIPGSIVVPATADLTFEALTPGTDRGLLFLDNQRLENAGSLDFRNLGGAFFAASGANTGSMSIVDCDAAVGFFFEPSATRGSISISGTAPLALAGDMNTQDITITSLSVRADGPGLTLRDSTVVGTLTVKTQLTFDNNPASAAGDLHLILNGATLAYLGAEPSGNLASLDLASNSSLTASKLTLSRDLAVTGGSLLLAPAPLDLAGNELTISGAGTAVNFGGLVDMNNGTVSVSGNAEIQVETRFNGINGGRLAVAAPATARLESSGELHLLDLEIPGQTLIGEGGTLRSVEIPAGSELTGDFTIRDGVELNGRIVLGSVNFANSPEISGNGEFEFPQSGSANLGRTIDTFSVPIGAVLSMVGGSGVVRANMLNDGRAKVLAQGIKFEKLSRNSGSLEVSEGTTEIGGTIDNTGGTIESNGNGRIEIGDPLRSTSSNRITGGTIRNNSAKRIPAGVLGAAGAVTVWETHLKNVTIEGLIEVLPGDGPGEALKLDTSLTNNGVLAFQRNTDLIQVVTTADGGVGTPFEIFGSGTIDFGDGSVATPVNVNHELVRFVTAPDHRIINRGNTLRGNGLVGAQFVFSNTEAVNEGQIIVADPIGFQLGVSGEDATNSGLVDVESGGTFIAGSRFFNDGVIQVAAGGSLDGTGSFTNRGTLIVPAGASFNSFSFTMDAGTATIAGALAGSIVQNGGNLGLEGDLLGSLLINGGTFNVGRPTQISSTFFMGPTASLEFDIGGTLPGVNMDQLRTTTTSFFGDSTFDGNLVVKTQPGYTPQALTSLEVIQFVGERNGTEFDQVVNNTAFPAVTFEAEYTADNFGFVNLLVDGDPSIVEEADITVAAGQCDSRSGPNRTHDYVVIVSNAGTDPVDNLGVEIFLPIQIQLNPVPALPAECTQNGFQVNCSFTSLGVVQNITLPLGVTVGAGASGSLTLSASATADQSDPVPGNNSATLETEIVTDLIEVDGFESCGGAVSP